MVFIYCIWQTINTKDIEPIKLPVGSEARPLESFKKKKMLCSLPPGKNMTFSSLMENSTIKIYARHFLGARILPPTLSNQPSIKLRVTKDVSHQRDQSDAFGFPFGWFTCCQASKLLIEQESKGRVVRGKRDEGERNILQSKLLLLFFLFIINSHWRRRVKLTEGDERQLCLFVLSLSVLLGLFLSPCQGTSFGRERAPELGKASVSIYPHHYPHRAPPRASPVHKMTFWPLASAGMWLQETRRRGDRQSYSPMLLGEMQLFLKKKTNIDRYFSLFMKWLNKYKTCRTVCIIVQRDINTCEIHKNNSHKFPLKMFY